MSNHGNDLRECFEISQVYFRCADHEIFGIYDDQDRNRAEPRESTGDRRYEAVHNHPGGLAVDGPIGGLEPISFKPCGTGTPVISNP